MQLYHHAFSLNSQKVRLALEEKGMDYISHSLNPLKAKDLDPSLFKVNPDGKLPVFQNGNLILVEALAIVQFIDSVNEPLGDGAVDKEKRIEWMCRTDDWDPKFFTLSHVPPKLRKYFSRFKRRVAIARMAQNPELADKYHKKLHLAYATDEAILDKDALKANERQLVTLLDMAEEQLSATQYLAGDAFSMADVMFLPVLGWLGLLGLEKEYIHPRKSLFKYWTMAKRRPSYRTTIGKYFGGLYKYKTFLLTAINVAIRDLLRKY